mgnify:CR=1 FL=1
MSKKHIEECVRDSLEAYFKDLRGVGVSILTLGQYLRPSPDHAVMTRYYHPDEFAELKRIGVLRDKAYAVAPDLKAGRRGGTAKAAARAGS